MVAVTGIGHAPPGPMSVPSLGDEPVVRRIVALAVSPMELLRPGSDLARLVDGVGLVDLLLACENEPVGDPSPVGILSVERPGAAAGSTDLDPADLEHDGFDDDGDDPDDDADELRAAADDLGLVDLRLHRLALSAPLTGAAEPDLVAALSELVGFDPEPGVQILAPAAAPGDPQRAVVDRAVQRIVTVYGLPLERYRCLELSVVDGCDGSAGQPAG